MKNLKLSRKGFAKTVLLSALLAVGGLAAAQSKIALISHAPDSDSWWNTIKNSVKQAGEDYGVQVDYPAIVSLGWQQ